MMHFSIYLTLVATLTHFQGIECFNLGRNVPIFEIPFESLKTSVTDQSSITKGDPVLKVDDHLAKKEELEIFNGPMFRKVVEQNGFSNEVVGSQITNFLASTQKPQVIPAAQELRKVDEGKSVKIKSLITNLDDSISFEGRDRVPVQVPVKQVVAAGREPEQVSKPTRINDFNQSDEGEEDDNSNEVRSGIAHSARVNKDGKDSSFERIITSLDATDFHKRPASGVLIQPESEDWFLVKQYMDDESFRGSNKELAKEYFWQPVKGSKGLDSDSEEDDSNESA